MKRFAYVMITLLLLADVLSAFGQSVVSETAAETKHERIPSIPAQAGLPLPSRTLTIGSLSSNLPSIAGPVRRSEHPSTLTTARWTAGSGGLAGMAALPGLTETGSSRSRASTGQGGPAGTLVPLMERAAQFTPELSPQSTGRSGYGTGNAFDGGDPAQQRLGARPARGHEAKNGVASTDDVSDVEQDPKRNHTSSFSLAPTSEGMTIRLMATADGLQLVLQSKSGMNGSILADRSGTSLNKGENAPGWWSWTAGRGSWAPVNVLTSSPLSHLGGPGEALIEKMKVDPQADK